MKQADRKRGHEAGMAAVRRGESYQHAFAAALGHLTPLPPSGAPTPNANGGFNPAGVRDDPIWGREAQLRRWRELELDPDGPFIWPHKQ
jgi:hypothetical protein